MIPNLRPLRAALAAGAALAALAACAADSPSRVEFVDRIDWSPAAHQSGGFSGLEMLEDGVEFTTISDRGALVRGRLIREGGRLVAVEQDPPQPLTDAHGRPLAEDWTDAEGLAMDADGRLYVSFEGFHRVTAYDAPLRASDLDTPQDFDALISNAGLEALAIDAQGRLYTLPERSGQMTRPFPVWRHENGRWSQPFTISRSGGFLPVGADFGPDGRFYLLEREFTGFAFRSRIRRFALAEDHVVSEETLLETPAHRHGNLESIAVWRDPTGTLRLTLLSDDNFRGFQRSEFVEYRVAE